MSILLLNTIMHYILLHTYFFENYGNVWYLKLTNMDQVTIYNKSNNPSMKVVDG